MGDCHAIQGDSEIFNPFEMQAVVTITPYVLKNLASEIAWPRVETEREIMTVVSDKPFDAASREAAREMIKWLVAEFHYNASDAAFLCGQVADLRVCQIVGTLYTACYVVPKEFI